MVALKDTLGKRLPPGANPFIHWNTFLRFAMIYSWRRDLNPLVHLIKKAALRNPMVVQKGTYRKRLTAVINPFIHWNTYLRISSSW
jgi:hypothetical protein